MTRPRVLGVFLDRPWPGATGDMQRVAALVDAIRPHVEAEVFLAPRGPGAGTPPTGLHVVEAVRPRDTMRAVARFIGGLPRSRPPMMAFYRQRQLRAALAQTLERVRPDIVLTHHLGGAGLVEGLVEPSHVILDLPNSEVQRFERMAAMTGGVQSARFVAERALTARWVQRRLGSFRATTVVSAEDEAEYQRLSPDARLVTVPNGTTPPSELRPDPGGREILFLGDLAYLPNAEGLSWFADQVLPRADVVSALRVVGRGTAPRADRVHPVGRVEALEPELARVVAMVVPIRAGGGTRLKVLDAFGHGVPVISTELGVEGLGAVAGVHYVRAESAAEWVEALDTVLGDRGLRARLAEAGRALVDARFTWRDATAPLVELVVG